MHCCWQEMTLWHSGMQLHRQELSRHWSGSWTWNGIYLISPGFTVNTDAEAQLKAAAATTATTDSSRTSSEALNSTQYMRPTSSSSPLYSSFSSSPPTLSAEAEAAQFVGGAQSSSGGIAAIIEYRLWIIFIIYAFVQCRNEKKSHCKIQIWPCLDVISVVC